MTNEPWFRAKRVGYGAGLPIRWQGWLVVLVVAGAVGVIERLMAPLRPLLAALLVGLVVAAMLALASRHTEGGPWRWRG